MSDPTIKHPSYLEFAPSWELMRDAVDGEDQVKSKGVKYLPMKTGTAAIENPAVQKAVYDLYKTRAEFPEITAPTIRGAVGIATRKAVKVELPESMEGMREKATLCGLTMDALFRRIITEVMTVGRYGLLPSVTSNGDPYLSGYVAESITNWDSTDSIPDYVALNESGYVRDRETGEWNVVDRIRECTAYEEGYRSALYEDDGTGNYVLISDEVGLLPNKQPLYLLPFVFIGSLDLTPEPDDVPLYGLAKIAVRIYRLDADYSFSLHMTSEPTPVAIGFDDPASAIENGSAPKTLGSSVMWILPSGGDAKYLEFSGPGLEKQFQAIQDAFSRAAQQGAQVIQMGSSAESGEALRLRAASQTATLTTVVQTAAAGLERALRNLAVWIGADPAEVIVTADTEFLDANIDPQMVTALVGAWQSGAISHDELFYNLQQGGVIREDTKLEDEQTAIGNDDRDLEQFSGIIPPINPSAEGAIT